MLHAPMLIVSAKYKPLAGGAGGNTIRLFDGKYLGMHPGDAVVMAYTKAADQPVYASERLVISAMAIATLDVLVRAHGDANADFWDLEPETETEGPYDPEAQIELFEAHIRSFYDGIPGFADENTLFVAIYF